MTTMSHWISTEDPSRKQELDSSGLIIPARSLNIVWGRDPRYWEWMDLSQETELEGFEKAAVLHQVNWLEVVGNLTVASSTLIPSTFEVYYVVKFRVDAFGWDSVKIKFKINADGEDTEKTVDLEPYTTNNETWYEINGGEFKIFPGKAVSLSFGMLENGSQWWKGGMILAGVKIKPKKDDAKAKSSEP